jgi:hypothetical protein
MGKVQGTFLKLKTIFTYIGVTNKQGLDWMIGFIDHSLTITRNHINLQ